MRQVIFWVVVIVGAILIFRFFQNPGGGQPTQLSYSELLEKVESKQVATAVIDREKVNGKLVSQASYTTEAWKRVCGSGSR
jgi:ATP-dependent Zn protease